MAMCIACTFFSLSKYKTVSNKVTVEESFEGFFENFFGRFLKKGHICSKFNFYFFKNIQSIPPVPFFAVLPFLYAIFEILFSTFFLHIYFSKKGRGCIVDISLKFSANELRSTVSCNWNYGKKMENICCNVFHFEKDNSKYSEEALKYSTSQNVLQNCNI